MFELEIREKAGVIQSYIKVYSSTGDFWQVWENGNPDPLEYDSVDELLVDFPEVEPWVKGQV